MNRFTKELWDGCPIEEWSHFVELDGNETKVLGEGWAHPVVVGGVIDRLAAYEDSGLSPEEVQELAKAEADGRLVVLPCKVGTRVWVIGQDCDLCHDMYTEEPCLFGDCKYRKVIKRLSNTLWQTTWMWHL